jgi:hypothetical protein
MVFVDSMINQVVSRRFVKKQQMSWTQKGAHLLLQTRRSSTRSFVRLLTASARAEGGLPPGLLLLSLGRTDEPLPRISSCSGRTLNFPHIVSVKMVSSNTGSIVLISVSTRVSQ